MKTRVPDLTRKLARSLERITRPGSGARPVENLDAAFEVIESYEKLSGAVYRSGTDPAAQRLGADALNTAAHEIIGVSAHEKEAESAYRMFVAEYRAIWRRHFHLFLFTACVFFATAVVGWNLGVNQPDYVALFVDQAMMEKVQGHEAWFDSLQGSAINGGLSIAINNMKVALTGFLLGGALGLGSVAILGYNGLMIGSLLGYCRIHGFDSQLTGFILSHGPLEITIIIASCFAGLLIGRVFYLRPRALFAERMRSAAREAGVLALGIIPWLILAAFFEAFVSPSPVFDPRTKLLCGVLLAGAFWLWTFAPWAGARAGGRTRA